MIKLAKPKYKVGKYSFDDKEKAEWYDNLLEKGIAFCRTLEKTLEMPKGWARFDAKLYSDKTISELKILMSPKCVLIPRKYEKSILDKEKFEILYNKVQELGSGLFLNFRYEYETSEGTCNCSAEDRESDCGCRCPEKITRTEAYLYIEVWERFIIEFVEKNKDI